MNGNFFRNGVMVLALLTAMSAPSFSNATTQSALQNTTLSSSNTSSTLSTYSFSTVSGATDPASEALSATADFQVSAGSMVVTLTNLQTSITSVGQNISSLWFTVNNGSSVLNLSGANVSLSGNLINIACTDKKCQNTLTTSAGTLNNVALGTTGTSTENWSAGQGTSQFYFNDLNGGGQPDQTIIGPPDAGSTSSSNPYGTYNTVNNSIYGNTPHNPFIQKQATFTIADAGLLSTSTISNVQIGFGTAAAGGSNGGKVPEPGSLALLAIGALAFAGVLRRKTIEETHV